MLRASLTAGLLLIMASCSTLENDAATAPDQVMVQEETQEADAQLATSAVDLAESLESQHQEAVIYRGNDRLVRMPKEQPPVRFVGDDVSLNFEQAPLSEVMHAIMGDILALDYVVDQPVKGQVTLRTRTPVPRDQLLGVLESLLKANDTVMIRGEQGRYLVTSLQRGRRLSPSVSNPGDKAAGYSTIIIPLRYISAANMAEILKPVADESAFVRVDGARNLLMLAGTRDQLDGWLDIVTTFDVDQLAGMSVGLFPLENSSVEEVGVALKAMLAGGSAEEGGGGNLSQLIRIVPVQRLNSILIVTPRAHYLDTMQKWIERLDEAHYSEFDRRLYVYPVQNTTASRLSKLLNSIYGSGGGGGGQGGDTNSGGVAPGMTPETLTGGSGMGIGQGGSKGSKASGGGTSAVSMSGAFSGDMSSMVEDVRVVADDENNSLMIYATAMQYRVIESALQQLDIVATQVIIEASILEVTLTDELEYGLEWAFNNGLNEFGEFEKQGFLTKGTELPARDTSGFSYVLSQFDSSGTMDFNATLNALASESLLNVISSPSVMVLDNHEAYIHVGNQVPIISRQSTNGSSDSSLVTQSIEYRDTGVKLTVTPSVNAGGLVTMGVAQSVTDVGEIDAATGQRAFLERNIESRVAVRSGESVVLGGLIRENAASGSTGVPFLHNIPVIGSLFGTDKVKDTRTELLVVITPTAIYNQEELRQISEEMRGRIRNMELIELPPN